MPSYYLKVQKMVEGKLKDFLLELLVAEDGAVVGVIELEKDFPS
jgi:hypothetical protein